MAGSNSISRRTLDLVELALALGKPCPSREGNALIDRLMPTERNHARPGTMSFYFGLGRFPFHTDGAYSRIPPRFILLRLAAAAYSLRPTLLCDIAALALRAEEVRALTHDVWIVRGGRRPFLSSILNDSLLVGHTILRFDRCCMRPASPRSKRCARIMDAALDNSVPVAIHWSSGKVLVLDNWRVLHARGDGPLDLNEGRVLERASVTSRGA